MPDFKSAIADIAAQAPAGPGEEVERADITDLGTLLPLMDGVDAVIHLAGIPDESDWARMRSDYRRLLQRL